MDADIRHLLGKSPSSDVIVTHIKKLAELLSLNDVPLPEVKSYSDVVYFNYHKLGLSFQFSRKQTASPNRDQSGDDDCLSLVAMDLYNAPELTSSRSTRSPFSSYPSLPLQIPLEPSTGGGSSEQPSLTIIANTTGKDFVGMLGEPSRKGGGTGSLSGSINIWCEWTKDGIMVEFGGEDARGPHAWERGKDTVWKVITVFSPSGG